MNQSREEKPIDPTTAPSGKAPSRRSFLRKGLAVSGAGVVGAGLLNAGMLAPSIAFAHDRNHSALTKGDAAILRFLAALETVESDLWQQYNELGGIQDSEVPGGHFIPQYQDALNALDADMSQYIHDNTDDEFSHMKFLNFYLAFKGADPVDLTKFATLPSSKATGAQQIGRLTNLMQLAVDTSWWTRYRSDSQNPDIDHPKFDQAVPGISTGQHPAIPRDDSDLAPHDHIQAIANTAAFHFAFIEQGGTSLYPSLAQRVSNVEVLRILLSIGPTETAHFQTWHDKAGNAVSDPLAPLTDPNDTTVVFRNLNVDPGGEEFQTNLIMPEPTIFVSRKFPIVSIIRPTETKGAAMGAVKALTDDGLFIDPKTGKNSPLVNFLKELAEEADEAERD